MTRKLYEIAADITRTWPRVNYAALPYLRAMRELSTLNDMYMYDTAESIVRYFLANATSWRGEDARRIKAELNAMLKSKQGR